MSIVWASTCWSCAAIFLFGSWVIFAEGKAERKVLWDFLSLPSRSFRRQVFWDFLSLTHNVDPSDE
jgi:hypothetical protein